MKHDYSYGIIPLRYLHDKWEVFLVQHHAGHWAFPKGHAEKDETPSETAERELIEETGLTVVRYITQIPFEETYFFTHQHERIHKKVFYFVAIVQGDFKLQELEIKNGQWLSFSDAFKTVTFSQAKSLCQKVQDLL
ncbi:MAG: NUDIX domain-containing protein [Parachlamydiaceae bacterium]|nr:NUDIX domain-containing protein [Parachlamydiaceae bacterium]